MERINNVLKLDYLDVHNIRYTLKVGELTLVQFFETQEFLHGLFLESLTDVELPEEHSDLKEIVWGTLKDYKGKQY
ncbi:hypothetical protein J2W98_000523 [Paenibacillus peoriae]|uniref:Uncharacterized protein n=1 Tax=Paenibacillus peoriae TaxID=59893 RepID=A0ABU1Q9G7_9BACL|nr:hypothetical protein [Paenibacillus peoriae]MDR6776276.1 hypothetical protein [Paenibacillus peoriae]